MPEARIVEEQYICCVLGGSKKERIKVERWLIRQTSDDYLFCSWLRSVTLSCNFVSWDSILQLGTCERWLDCYSPQETNHLSMHLSRDHSNMTSHFLEGCFPHNNTEAYKIVLLFVDFLLWLWVTDGVPWEWAYQHHRSLNWIVATSNMIPTRDEETFLENSCPQNI